mgnify:CR=1 FL=1
MIVVESNKEIEHFMQMWENNPSIVVPIWCDLEKHPMNNELAFLFIRVVNTNFILIYNHIDGKSHHLDLSTSTQPKWVWNKKGLLQTDTNIQNIFDISNYNFFEGGKLIPDEVQNQSFISHYIRMGIRENLGKKYASEERAKGNVPCVLYGGEKPVHFSAFEGSFKQLLFTPYAYI